MGLLVFGLFLFVAIHLVPAMPPWREKLVTRFGENAYKGMFSIVSMVGLVLVGIGFSQAQGDALWAVTDEMKALAVFVMPVVFVLMVAAYAPTHMRSVLRHPMAMAVTLWAGLHLLANADARALVLFGGLGLYSIFSAVSAHRRGKSFVGPTVAFKFDIVAVVVGFIAYALVLYGHGYLFDRPLV